MKICSKILEALLKPLVLVIVKEIDDYNYKKNPMKVKLYGYEYSESLSYIIPTNKINNSNEIPT